MIPVSSGAIRRAGSGKSRYAYAPDVLRSRRQAQLSALPATATATDDQRLRLQFCRIVSAEICHGGVLRAIDQTKRSARYSYRRCTAFLASTLQLGHGGAHHPLAGFRRTPLPVSPARADPGRSRSWPRRSGRRDKRSEYRLSAGRLWHSSPREPGPRSPSRPHVCRPGSSSRSHRSAS